MGQDEMEWVLLRHNTRWNSVRLFDVNYVERMHKYLIYYQAMDSLYIKISRMQKMNTDSPKVIFVKWVSFQWINCMLQWRWSNSWTLEILYGDYNWIIWWYGVRCFLYRFVIRIWLAVSSSTNKRIFNWLSYTSVPRFCLQCESELQTILAAMHSDAKREMYRNT